MRRTSRGRSVYPCILEIYRPICREVKVSLAWHFGPGWDGVGASRWHRSGYGLLRMGLGVLARPILDGFLNVLTRGITCFILMV